MNKQQKTIEIAKKFMQAFQNMISEIEALDLSDEIETLANEQKATNENTEVSKTDEVTEQVTTEPIQENSVENTEVTNEQKATNKMEVFLTKLEKLNPKKHEQMLNRLNKQ